MYQLTTMSISRDIPRLKVLFANQVYGLTTGYLKKELSLTRVTSTIQLKLKRTSQMVIPLSSPTVTNFSPKQQNVTHFTISALSVTCR